MDTEDTILKYRSRTIRRFFTLFTPCALLLCSIYAITYHKAVSNFLLVGYRPVIIVSIVTFIISLASMLISYLKFKPFYYSSFYDRDAKMNLNSYLTQSLKSTIINKYGPIDSNALIRMGQKSKVSPFENDIESFRKKFIEETLKDMEHAKVFEELNTLEVKFKEQIERLTSNSNLNLTIGIITTSLAIIILGFSMFTQKETKTTVEFLSYFLPRISTVIFVEVFSFFFLKLYKSNLSEIKYFQNEITNLNFKIVSLKTALKSGTPETLAEVIKGFSVTERNFVLKAGESTERIETHKIDVENSKGLLDAMKGLVESLKK